MDDQTRKIALGGIVVATVGTGLFLAWSGSRVVRAVEDRASRPSTPPRVQQTTGASSYNLTPVSGSVPGVTVAPGIRLSARQWAFIRNLRAVVPSWVPITVTSGLRSMEQQTQIMWDFWKENGTDKFVGLYNVAAKRLMALPYASWPAEIRRMYETGILHSDEHTGGGAIDIHYRTLTGEQQEQLVLGATKLGADPLIEDPPLLHVSHIPA